MRIILLFNLFRVGEVWRGLKKTLPLFRSVLCFAGLRPHDNKEDYYNQRNKKQVKVLELDKKKVKVLEMDKKVVKVLELDKKKFKVLELDKKQVKVLELNKKQVKMLG